MVLNIFRKFTILLVIILLIQSCKDPETLPDRLTSYPMNIGTEWIYDREFIIKKYESETSEDSIENDTMRFTISVRISKDTTLRDSIAVTEFIANEIGTQLYSKEYFKLDKDGLKTYAYIPTGQYAFEKKKNAEIIGNIKFKTFQLEPVIIDNEGDNFYFYDTPRLSLKLPLSVGDKWTYLSPTEFNNLQIEKEVLGFERLKFSFGTFDCFKIKYNNTGIEGIERLEIIDWVSVQGLIKRQIKFDRNMSTTIDGDLIQFVDWIDILTIKELTIK